MVECGGEVTSSLLTVDNLSGGLSKIILFTKATGVQPEGAPEKQLVRFSSAGRTLTELNFARRDFQHHGPNSRTSAHQHSTHSILTTTYFAANYTGFDDLSIAANAYQFVKQNHDWMRRLLWRLEDASGSRSTTN